MSVQPYLFVPRAVPVSVSSVKALSVAVRPVFIDENELNRILIACDEYYQTINYTLPEHWSGTDS